MGVFGYGEIIANLSKPEDEREVFAAKVTGLMPTAEDFKRMLPAMLRGTALGSALGILPGGGALALRRVVVDVRGARTGADGTGDKLRLFEQGLNLLQRLTGKDIGDQIFHRHPRAACFLAGL